jgi:hypothetical protein
MNLIGLLLKGLIFHLLFVPWGARSRGGSAIAHRSQVAMFGAEHKLKQRHPYW